MPATKLIIFTDLDGTLLDHHTYSWQAAAPSLAKLRQQQVPLVLCTSKTAAEVFELHRELQLGSPYIVENGAGIIFSPTSAPNVQNAHFLGTPYPKLIEQLQQLRRSKGYLFQGFNDFSVAEVMTETDLPEHQARLAKQRLCSEPLLWEDTEQALNSFRNDLDELELQLLRGGRFFHVLGKQADKGSALKHVLDTFKQQPQTRWFSVALGDGPNDQSMLDAADLAVVIPSANGIGPNPRNTKVRHAPATGPEGWNHVILELLAEQAS